MRTLLSDQLKCRIRADARSQGELASLVHLNHTQLSWFMHDRVGIGLYVRPRIVALGAILGVPEPQCFREVRRD